MRYFLPVIPIKRLVRKIRNIVLRKKLFRAFREKKWKEVSCCISKLSDVNFRDRYKNTPLIYACNFNWKKMIIYLIKRGAEVNVINKYSNTPLSLACERVIRVCKKVACAQENLACAQANLVRDRKKESFVGASNVRFRVALACANAAATRESVLAARKKVAAVLKRKNSDLRLVSFLLEKGARVNVKRDILKEDPLIFACRNNNIDLVELLSNTEYSYNETDVFDIADCSPKKYEYIKKVRDMALLIACKMNFHEIALKLLSDFNADVNARSKRGWTPLMFACCYFDEKKDCEYAKILGKDLLAKHLLESEAQVNVSNVFGDTPLLLACASDYRGLAGFLITYYQADVNVANKLGKTPLLCACANKNFKLAKFLIMHGAKVNVRDIYGDSPLLYAFFYGDYKFARFLINSCHAILDASNRKGGMLLLNAFRESDFEFFNDLISHGADVNFQDEHGNTPLMLACQKGDIELVSHLMEKCDAKVNIQNKEGDTPLLLALNNGRLLVAKFLINECDACIDVRDSFGDTPLLLVCKIKKQNPDFVLAVELADLLISKGAEVNVEDDLCNTPFLFACKNDNFKLAVRLLQAGADVDVKDHSGFAALDIAFENDNIRFAKIILERMRERITFCRNYTDFLIRICKENVLLRRSYEEDDIDQVKRLYIDLIRNLIDKGASVNAWDLRLRTSLFYACFNENLPLVALLLECGAWVNFEDENKETPLFVACRNGNLEVAKILLENGADIEHSNKNWEIPFMVACKRKKYEIAQYLITQGADVNRALMFACTKGYLEIVEFLLENGAEVHFLHDKPLLRACDEKHLGIAKLLIAKGADVDFALCAACIGYNVDSPEYLEAVKFLLNNGANVNAVLRKTGDTPLFFACRFECWSIVKYLIKKGAVVNCKNKKGETPLDYIYEKGSHCLVELLKLIQCYRGSIRLRKPSRKPLKDRFPDKRCHTSDGSFVAVTELPGQRCRTAPSDIAVHRVKKRRCKTAVPCVLEVELEKEKRCKTSLGSHSSCNLTQRRSFSELVEVSCNDSLTESSSSFELDYSEPLRHPMVTRLKLEDLKKSKTMECSDDNDYPELINTPRGVRVKKDVITFEGVDG